MNKFSKHIEQLKANYRAAYLIHGFNHRWLTEEEKDELDEWILANDDNMKLFEDLTEEKTKEEFLKWYSNIDTEAKLEEVKKRIQFESSSKVVSIWRFVAAACVVAIIAIGIYLYLDREDKPLIVQTSETDIRPGLKQAILKLPSGKIVLLHGLQDSVINDQVTIKGGELVYQKAMGGEISYHEVSIPRKGYYRLVLPDGSRVLLNNETTIRYPSIFNAGIRRVELVGEAYFDVAKDPSQPFIVSVNGTDIQALGTAFNVFAYPNEPVFVTTLVEGSIKVSNASHQQLLTPNQQIIIRGNEWDVKEVDISPATAWIKNEFKLKDTPLEQVMRMLARWYDAKVIYDSKPNFHFNGTISRDLPVSRLLKLLEETGHVHFTIEGNTITVKD